MRRYFYILVAVLLLAWLVIRPAHAGYYATLTGSYGNWSGTVSGCYLVPSMAIQAVFSSYNFNATIDQLNPTSLAWHGYANMSQYGTTRWFQGTMGSCTAQPAVTSIPGFLGSVTDPAISSSGVLSGGAPSSSSSSSSVDWSQFDAVNAGAIWGFMFATSILIWWVGEQIGMAISVLNKS